MKSALFLYFVFSGLALANSNPPSILMEFMINNNGGQSKATILTSADTPAKLQGLDDKEQAYVIEVTPTVIEGPQRQIQLSVVASTRDSADGEQKIRSTITAASGESHTLGGSVHNSGKLFEIVVRPSILSPAAR